MLAPLFVDHPAGDRVEHDDVLGPSMTGEPLTAVELWFSTDSLADHRDLLSINASSHVQALLYHNTNGKIAVWKSGSDVLVSDSTVSTNENHHVALWYESGSGKTYLMIDGDTQTNTYTGNLLSATNPVVIMAGYYYSGGLYSRALGEVDEVAVYDGSMTESDFENRVASGYASIAYDENGNRTSVLTGSGTTSYTYATDSNQLTAIGGSSVTHDAAGNRSADPGGTRTYVYNDANRLVEVLDNSSTTAEYVHNALGQRVKKTVGSAVVVYIYDVNGHLIAEHDASGNYIRDYVWLDGLPVAQIDSGEVFSYLHFDHLGTPRMATNDSQTVVWRWDSDAFGSIAPDEDPDGDSNDLTVNLRFPGQYLDGETGLYYNYFRDYDPVTGRYIQSDPIGLGGGLNTYAYGDANPLGNTDPTGEFANIIVGAITGVATGYAIAWLTGDKCYGIDDALKDAALGAVGAGLLSKANKLYRIAKLRNIARSRGLTNVGRRGYVETWKGGRNLLERLNIKHGAARSPGLQSGSRVPRYDYRIDAGKYWDPFTGAVGPAGALSHVPLEPFIPVPAAVAGGLAGASGSAVDSAGSCGCE